MKVIANIYARTFLVLLFFIVSGAKAAIIDFEEFTNPTSFGGAGSSLVSQGYLIDFGQDNTTEIQDGTFCGPECPQNGSNMLFNQDSGNFTAITITNVAGDPFSLNSFDAAESFVSLMFEADKINVAGIKVDGTLLNDVFSLDHINDGPGSLADFQTFHLSTDYSDLISFSLNGAGGFYDGSNNGFTRNDFSLDNIRINEEFLSCSEFPGGGATDGCFPGPGEFPGGGVSVVPVPAAFWLFGTALIGLVGFSKRRKAA